MTVVVEAVAVEDESVSLAEENQEEVGESQGEPDSQQELPSPTVPALANPSAIASLKKPDLIKHLEAHGLPTDGLTKDLKSRLTAYVLNQRTITAPKAAA